MIAAAGELDTFGRHDRGASARQGSKQGFGGSYFSVLGEIDLERLGVVLKPERRHGEQDILAVDSLPLLLVTLLGCCTTGSVPPREWGQRSRHTFAGDERDELADALLACTPWPPWLSWRSREEHSS